MNLTCTGIKHVTIAHAMSFALTGLHEVALAIQVHATHTGEASVTTASHVECLCSIDVHVTIRMDVEVTFTSHADGAFTIHIYVACTIQLNSALACACHDHNQVTIIVHDDLLVVASGQSDLSVTCLVAHDQPV